MILRYQKGVEKLVLTVPLSHPNAALTRPLRRTHLAIEGMCMPCQGNADAHHTTPRVSAFRAVS
ncbi:hypothetical protein [Actinacidiphila glaucinigra]|uniref:hypothetical protein n=1 Tax=Actinacidiphila glaucinigra TaxID=235986 RepID=UPI003D8BA309